MSAVKIRKIYLEDLDKHYTNKKTRATYDGLFKKFINALEQYPTVNENGKTGVVFHDIEEYEDFVKDCQRTYKTMSMRQMFYGMFGGLAKRFHFPSVYGLNVGFRPKQHEGFTPLERQKILDYCLSDQDDNERLMCVSKFTTLLLLETGLRGDEFHKFMEKFVDHKFVQQCLHAENMEEMLNTLENSRQIVTIIGKGHIPRQVSITPNAVRLGKKVIDKERSTCFKISITRDQVYNRFHHVVDKLEMRCTPHDCRVSFATYLYSELGLKLPDIKDAMGHTSIEQTIKYIRSYDVAQTVTRAIIKGKANKANDLLVEVRNEMKTLKSEVENMVMMFQTAIKNITKN